VAHSPKRLNIPVLVAVLIGGVLLAAIVMVVHRVQVTRNAGALARLAQAKLEAGDSEQALGLYARYLAYRPHDAAAQAAFARLIVADAERPDATRNDRLFAYGALDTAVRKNPDDLQLRWQLVDWMLRFRRFGDASQELAVLQQRLTEAGPESGIPPSLDINAVNILRARAFIGLGEFSQAASAVAAILGFDLEQKAFVEDAADAAPKPTSEIAREAALVLASLLESKLNATDAAAAVFEHLVHEQPDDVRSWLALAQWHQAHGGLDKAAAAVREAATLAPDNPDVLFCDIDLSLAEKRYDVAERIAAKARSLFPDDERSFRAQAAVAVRRQQPDQAVAILNEGLTRFPEQFGLLRMLGDMLLQANRIDEAAAAIATLTKLHGDKRAAVGLLQARLLMAQKRWLQARKSLEAIRPLVAESNATVMQVDLLLGQCHEMLGDFDEQLAANRRVLLEDHKSLAAQIGVANALAASGKQDDALAEFEAIAAAMPKEQLAKLGPIWSPLLQLRIAAQMRLPPAARNWSLVDQLIGQLETSPGAAASQLALIKADVLVRKGQMEEAMELLQAEVAADPSNPQARAALAVQTLREKGPTAARELLAAAPAETADDPLFLGIRVQAAGQSPPAEAAATLADLEQKALSLRPNQALRLLSMIAAVQRGIGRPEEAERVLKAALKIEPDDMGAHAALFDLATEQRLVDQARSRAADIGRLAGPTSPEARVAEATVITLSVQLSQAARAGAAAANQEPELSPEEQAQLVTAKTLLIEAENVRPGWQQIQQAFADVARLQGDSATAIERLQKALRLGPTNPTVVRKLVSLLYLANRLEETRQALSLVGPDGLDGLERLSAELDLRAGQFDRAVAMAERSVSGDRTSSATDLLWFGQLLARAGRHDQAREVLLKAVAADPHEPAGWTALFLSQVAVGAMPAAEQTLEKGAAALADTRRQLFLAQANEVLGRIDEAEGFFREAQAAAHGDAAISRSLAGFLLRQGRLTKARVELNALIAATGSDQATRQARIWARRALAELLSQGGTFRTIEQALQLLRDNAAETGTSSADDLSLAVTILAPRPEPESWRRALAMLDTISTQQPLSTAQRIQKAILFESLGRWGECRDELLSIASAPNTPPTFQSLLIEKLIAHKELASARIWLRTLADQFPDAPLVAALQARLALAEQDRPAAVAAARRLLSSTAEYAETSRDLEILSTLLESLGFASGADEMFSRYAAASTDGILARAGFLGRSKRIDEALDLLDASWDKVPLENLLRTAVVVLTESGPDRTPQQAARVATLFERGQRLDPDSPTLALLYAEFLGISDRSEDVVATYRALLARQDLTPQQAAIAANNLAFHLAAPKTVAEAGRLIASARDELGPHPDVLDTQGLVLLAAGKFPEAVAELRESIIVPSATKYLHLAVALAANQDPAGAREALAEARGMGLAPAALTPHDRARLATLEATLGQ